MTDLELIRSLRSQEDLARDSAINAKANAEEERKKAISNDFWGNLGASGYSALNSVGMGLPDFLVKNIAGSQSYKDLQAMKEKYREASGAGEVAGTLGSMFIPGGAIAKGAGKGLELASLGGKLTPVAKLGEGLTNVGKAIGGTGKIGNFDTLGSGIVRGAGASLEQAVPRALIEAGTTEDASNIPLEIALGGGLGAGLGGLGTALSKGGKAISNKLLKNMTPEKALAELADSAGDTAALITLGKTNVTKRDLMREMQTLNRPIYAGKNMDEMASDVADFAKARGYDSPKLGERRLKDDLEKLTAKWDEFVPKTGESPKMASLLDTYSQRPGVDLLLRSEEKAPQMIAQLQSKIDKIPKTVDKRQALQDIIDIGYKKGPVDEDQLLKSKLASEMREHYDEHLAELSGKTPEEVAKMKAEYGKMRLLAGASARNQADVAGAEIKEGSNTAMKLALGSTLGGFGLSSLTGNQPEDNQMEKLGAGVIGAVGGGILSRNATKASTALKEQYLRKLKKPALEALSKVAGGENKTINAIGDLKLPEWASKALPKAPGAMVGSDLINQDKPKLQTEAQSQAQEQAKAETNEKYQSVILQNLGQQYQMGGFAEAGIPYDEFIKVVYQKSNGFDPHIMAPLVFPDPKQAQQYLADYDKVKQVKSIDIQSAEKGGGLFASAEDKKNLADLKGAFESIVTKGGEKDLSKNAKQAIHDDIELIFKQDATPEQKQAMIVQLLGQKYGVDMLTLQNMGAV